MSMDDTKITVDEYNGFHGKSTAAVYVIIQEVCYYIILLLMFLLLFIETVQR